jgi:hypothetical protein
MKVFEKYPYQRLPIIGKKIPILGQSNTFECRLSANYGAILSAGSLVHKLSNKRPNLFTLIKTSPKSMLKFPEPHESIQQPHMQAKKKNLKK